MRGIAVLLSLPLAGCVSLTPAARAYLEKAKLQPSTFTVPADDAPRMLAQADRFIDRVPVKRKAASDYVMVDARIEHVGYLGFSKECCNVRSTKIGDSVRFEIEGADIPMGVFGPWINMGSVLAYYMVSGEEPPPQVYSLDSSYVAW